MTASSETAELAIYFAKEVLDEFDKVEVFPPKSLQGAQPQGRVAFKKLPLQLWMFPEGTTAPFGLGAPYKSEGKLCKDGKGKLDVAIDRESDEYKLVTKIGEKVVESMKQNKTAWFGANCTLDDETIEKEFNNGCWNVPGKDDYNPQYSTRFSLGIFAAKCPGSKRDCGIKDCRVSLKEKGELKPLTPKDAYDHMFQTKFLPCENIRVFCASVYGTAASKRGVSWSAKQITVEEPLSPEARDELDPFGENNSVFMSPPKRVKTD